ncbi:helicase Cas3 [compost metagenome]
MDHISPFSIWLIEEAKGKLHAHTSDGDPDKIAETLEQHSDLVLHYAEMLLRDNGVDKAIYRSLHTMKIDGECLDIPTVELIHKYFIQAIYLHDLGKVNPAFQRKKMKNTFVANKGGGISDTTHSLLSSVLYLHIYLQELQQMEEETELRPSDQLPGERMYPFLRHTLYAFAYVISRHHTYLGAMDEGELELKVFEQEIRNKVRSIQLRSEIIYYYQNKTAFLQDTSLFDDIYLARNLRYNDMHSPYPFYILTKLLYSMMVASDFRATFHYKEQRFVEMNYFSEKLPLMPVLNAYQSGAIYQSILKYKNGEVSLNLDPINTVRTELFLETEKRLHERPEETMYYLEGPTGSGKTNMSINLALQLLDKNKNLNKIVYVFPFNALIEQTKQTLDKLFNKEELEGYRVEVINSITPMVTEQEIRAQGSFNKGSSLEESEPAHDYSAVLLQRQLLQYPVTLTSHVNLFNYLFGTGRESNLAFAHLCNSVIILDEIQSYRNRLWKEIIHFLRSFADTMNIKFIIMSATLPRLDLLMEKTNEENEVETYPLVLNRDKYFSNPVFRERVHLHFEWLNPKEKTDISILGSRLMTIIDKRRLHGYGNRILVEFISKKSAREFYNKMKEEITDIPIFELTGDDSPYYRKMRIDQLGKDVNTGQFYLQEVIVVATQVIEAGVDIDMDIGMKDISLLDSEEQFLGRINRSCNRSHCHAYFFDMDKASGVYRNDWRTEHDLHHEDYQRMLVNKDFSQFYGLSMQRINESRQLKGKDHWYLFERKVQLVDYKQVQNHMELIPDRSVTLFLNYPLETDEGTMEGKDVWDDYVQLMQSKKAMDHAEWRIRLSVVRQQMSYYTFTYQLDHGQTAPAIYSEMKGSLYYVENGTEFMEYEPDTRAWKFNRSKYNETEKGPLL